ncbi:MAG: protein kinase [Bryobacteraceae bacterium]|nr:protein kinase [Bryobacteraceae bacterium]
MNLVEVALARPPEEREQYLHSACPDPEIFGEAWNYVQWEQRMNSFLLDPLFPAAEEEQPLRPGDLLHHRFRIGSEVARGGMGVVYDAWDEKLDRRIAIKCAKSGFRKRLPPEVRHASEISHPNVCKIFEIHAASIDGEEIDFLTMEFLEGETLLDRMRRGPLGEKEAKIIGRQLCEGLAEAHRNHVIHGDLKSNNVILATAADGTTRAVITDFGLARRPVAARFETQSGETAGTPDYMAPELLMGGKASMASDVYALGVILHELASGRKPFPPSTSWEGRLRRRPPAVKHAWNPILRRCLDPDPARRFRDAGELAQTLTPAPSRRRMLTAAAAIVLAAVSYALMAVPGYRESVRLAVLPFESSRDTVNLAAELIRKTDSQMARLRGNAHTKLAIISLSSALRHKVDTAEKAGVSLGATHALHGSLSRTGDKLILQAYLMDTRSMAKTKEWKAEYAPEETRYIPVALAGMVTGALRLPPLQIAPAVNAAARQDYQAGLFHVRRDSGVDTALAHFQRAVAADPDSPLTHAALAEAQWFKYYLTKDPLWLDRTAESVRQAQQRNSDLAPVHRIAGLLQANSGWYESAAAEYRRAVELEPDQSDGYRRLGMVYEANNQVEEALAAYRAAVAAEPQYHRNHQALGTFYNTRADYNEAARHFEKTVALAPDEPAAHFALGTTYSYAGRFAEAEHELRLSINLGETPTALHTLGYVLMCQGRDREAIPFISRALGGWPERYLWWMNLGIVYRRVNLTAESRRANLRGLELAEKEIARNPRNGSTRAHLAYLCARLGDRRRAESEILQSLQLSPNDGDVRFAAVATYEALGRRDNALSILQSAPYEVLADVSRWPDVAGLHKDIRFLRLLASHKVQ